MKNRRVPTVLMVLLACSVLAGSLVIPAVAQQPGLAGAVESFKAGNEARAWTQFAENARAFPVEWSKLDGGFVAWVADQYRKQKRYKDALAICDRVVAKEGELKPDTVAAVLLVKGDVFRDQENYVAARMEYQGIERHKQYQKTAAGERARFRVVDIYRVTRDYEAAEEVLERLKDLPDRATQAEAYYCNARIACDRDSFDEAREYLEEVKRRVPEHVEALFLEAELNLREDRLQDPELEIGERVLSTYVIPGRAITMKMQDHNLAVVRGGAGIPVELKSSHGNDQEIVMLLPSPRDPTLFRGNMLARLGEAETNSSRMEITGADIVTYRIQESFQKANDLKYGEKKMTVAFDAELTATSGDFISSEDRDQELLRLRIARAAMEEGDDRKAYERERDTMVIRPGNAIRIQVVDADRDMGPEQDLVFVSARTTLGDAVDGVELQETEAHSGLFRGTLLTTNAPPRATASDTAEGSKPGSPISLKDGAAWSSLADQKKGKWYEVDLMTIQPLVEASVELADAAGLKVSLEGSTGEELSEIASTAPDAHVLYGYVDLAAHFEALEPTQTAAYMYTEVTSDSERSAVLKIGSCDGVVCWLNGERVHRNLGGRIWRQEEDVVSVTLKAGVNAILFRVTQMTGPWGASLTVLDAAGKPLPDFPSYPPAKDGVVTMWHVFDRLTPEEITVRPRINVQKPIRVRDEQFRWLEFNVAPTAWLRVEGNVLRTVFHRTTGLRRLRWVFQDNKGPGVTIQTVTVKNKFGQQVVPSGMEYADAKANRLLELGPGEDIEISYRDERRIQDEELRTARMHAGFHDATVQFEYDRITMNKKGDREIVYDRAVRYRADATQRLAIRVEDYDADLTSEMDKVKVLVETSTGESLWLDALETEEHSGEFVGILRLGDATGSDTLKVGEGVSITASYSDRENSDGLLEKIASVTEADNDAPELLLYRSVVIDETVLDARVPAKRGGEDEEKALSVRLQLSDKGTAEAPVVTSMDAPLVFRTIYAAAALSEASTFAAKVVTDRELQAALAEGRLPEYVEVAMSLVDEELAEFEAQVKLRTGTPDSYVDLDARRNAFDWAPRDDEKEVKETYLYVRGDDTVRVSVKALDTADEPEGYFKLASDAVLAFTDKNYEEEVVRIHLGDYLYLRTTDMDRDVSDGLDEVIVALSGKSGSQDLTLVESLPHSGTFVGRLKTEPAEAAAAEGDLGGAFMSAAYGETIKASYRDESRVLSAEARNVDTMLGFHLGADGALATFTKLFADPEIAVKTRLLTAEALFELAKDHRGMGQEELGDKELAEGKMTLEEAIADYPDTKQAAHAEFLLANLAQELEKYEEALERYNKVLSTWPDSEFAPRAQLKKGICLEKMEDYDNALDAYVELTYSYPRSPLVSDAVVRLGQHFYRTKEFAVAGRIFGNFEERNPEHELAPKALFLSAQSYLKGAEERKQTPELNGRYDAKCSEWLKEAVSQFDKLITTYDDDKNMRAEAMYWKADCCLKTRDMKNAYLTLKRLTFDHPETKWAKFARGQLVSNADAFKTFREE